MVARQVDGVSDVVDQITIQQSTSGPDTGQEMMKNGMKMEQKKHGGEVKHE